MQARIIARRAQINPLPWRVFYCLPDSFCFQQSHPPLRGSFMSRHFDAAFKDLLYWEGNNFSDHKTDAGGATKYGISLRFIKNLPLGEADINGDGHVTADDIKALTKSNARGFYLKHFWLHYQLGAIECEPVATKLLNLFVHMRGRTAGRVAQRALASCRVYDIKEDGYIGPLTQSAINEATCSNELAGMYLAALRAQQESLYRLIVAKDPKQTVFFNGWLRRARDQKTE